MKCLDSRGIKFMILTENVSFFDTTLFKVLVVAVCIIYILIVLFYTYMTVDTHAIENKKYKEHVISRLKEIKNYCRVNDYLFVLMNNKVSLPAQAYFKEERNLVLACINGLMLGEVNRRVGEKTNNLYGVSLNTLPRTTVFFIANLVALQKSKDCIGDKNKFIDNYQNTIRDVYIKMQKIDAKIMWINDADYACAHFETLGIIIALVFDDIIQQELANDYVCRYIYGIEERQVSACVTSIYSIINDFKNNIPKSKLKKKYFNYFNWLSSDNAFHQRVNNIMTDKKIDPRSRIDLSIAAFDKGKEYYDMVSSLFNTVKHLPDYSGVFAFTSVLAELTCTINQYDIIKCINLLPTNIKNEVIALDKEISARVVSNQMI